MFLWLLRCFHRYTHRSAIILLENCRFMQYSIGTGEVVTVKRTVPKTEPSTGRQPVKSRARYRGATVHATEGSRYYTLSRAAKYLKVNKRILLRAHQQGFLRLLKVDGRWQVAFMTLITAPVFTTGHAARRLGIHYATAREWVAKGWLQPVTVGYSPSKPRRRVSFVEIESAKKRRKGL